MSDIVERLRAVMRDHFYGMPRASRTCEDAAKEIERLRGLKASREDALGEALYKLAALERVMKGIATPENPNGD
ncbi:MAG TPA: hypothetical protein VGQ93_01560 [Lysobacter sp.]|nr:hypothetical protein [Lysobacter sp.]